MLGGVAMLRSRVRSAVLPAVSVVVLAMVYGCSDPDLPTAVTAAPAEVRYDGQECEGECVEVVFSEEGQTIQFTSTPPTPGIIGVPYNVAATATSGFAVTFSSLTTGICTVSGSVVSLLAPGQCTVAANQGGGVDFQQQANFLAAPQVTQTFTVGWPFSGFFKPILNSGLNVAKAGSTVKLKFSVGEDRGLNILATGYPTSAPFDCPAGAAGASSPTSHPGSSALRRQGDPGVYGYEWKTNKAWANTCRVFTLGLADGSTHTALFRFQ